MPRASQAYIKEKSLRDRAEEVDNKHEAQFRPSPMLASFNQSLGRINRNENCIIIMPPTSMTVASCQPPET